jgi:uncharacterized membrane protein YciS (DUF1049 family)
MKHDSVRYIVWALAAGINGYFGAWAAKKRASFTQAQKNEELRIVKIMGITFGIGIIIIIAICVFFQFGSRISSSAGWP